MNIFPNDKTIKVLRANGSTYKIKESLHLINVHGWSASEIRVMQYNYCNPIV